jgi:hypothetical protein
VTEGVPPVAVFPLLLAPPLGPEPPCELLAPPVIVALPPVWLPPPEELPPLPTTPPVAVSELEWSEQAVGPKPSEEMKATAKPRRAKATRWGVTLPQVAPGRGIGSPTEKNGLGRAGSGSICAFDGFL